MDQLAGFGWTDEFARKWDTLGATGAVPGRVVADFGTSLKVATPKICTAELSGKLAHHSNRENTPKVGDWVAVRLSDSGYAVIEEVVPRRSEIARKVTGKRSLKQTIAANVDVAFVLLALDNDFSVERLERFLYQLSVNSIQPVIVLNKADMTDSIGSYVAQLDMLALPIVISSAIDGSDADGILEHIHPGRTAILLGSSGVGKSTLTNQLLGKDIQRTQAVRASDSTGKHTTVHRELFVLPNGGLLIDTPGIRELQLWGTLDYLGETFEDIADLAGQCKYTTCRHGTEPACAVRAALAGGKLEAAHYANYLKMKGELATLEKKSTVRIKRSNKKSSRSVKRQARDTAKEMREETG